MATTTQLPGSSAPALRSGQQPLAFCGAKLKEFGLALVRYEAPHPIFTTGAGLLLQYCEPV